MSGRWSGTRSCACSRRCSAGGRPVPSWLPWSRAAAATRSSPSSSSPPRSTRGSGSPTPSTTSCGPVWLPSAWAPRAARACSAPRDARCRWIRSSRSSCRTAGCPRHRSPRPSPAVWRPSPPRGTNSAPWPSSTNVTRRRSRRSGCRPNASPSTMRSPGLLPVRRPNRRGTWRRRCASPPPGTHTLRPGPRRSGSTPDAPSADDTASRAAGLAQQAITELAGASAVADAARRGDHARRDLQVEVGLLYLRLGQYRSAAGDHVGAQHAFETAAQLIPDEPTPDRARALGSLAQLLMLDGRFPESAALAEQARSTAAGAGETADAELGHATCTLGVDLGYGGEIDRALAVLEDAAAIARRAGRLDDLMRTYANPTH